MIWRLVSQSLTATAAFKADYRKDSRTYHWCKDKLSLLAHAALHLSTPHLLAMEKKHVSIYCSLETWFAQTCPVLHLLLTQATLEANSEFVCKVWMSGWEFPKLWETLGTSLYLFIFGVAAGSIKICTKTFLVPPCGQSITFHLVSVMGFNDPLSIENQIF